MQSSKYKDNGHEQIRQQKKHHRNQQFLGPAGVSDERKEKSDQIQHRNNMNKF